MGWYEFKPYVSVAQRRAQAAREIARRIKQGQAVCPVVIEGRAIVSTFWGKAWCTNLESYSDFENRLPRGRTYVRNGSVVHLKIEKGRITALVSGSELYEVQIDIAPLPAKSWQVLKKLCAGKIGSLVELLQGKLSNAVMEAVTNRTEGLFPKPTEIKMRCSCPDYAGLCKHLAAVMYGIGNRLDTSPELLFQLRGVDHQELIEQAIPTSPARAKGGVPTIESSDLGTIFDIEIDEVATAAPTVSKVIASKPPRPKNAVKGKVAPATATAKPGPATKTKAAPNKSASAKQAVSNKSTSAKKAVPNKSASAKKAAPDKSASAKKAAPNKSASAKKAAPNKSASAKKAAPDKSASAKQPTLATKKKATTATRKG